MSLIRNTHTCEVPGIVCRLLIRGFGLGFSFEARTPYCILRVYLGTYQLAHVFAGRKEQN